MQYDYDDFVKESEELFLSSEFRELEDKLEFHEANIWQILGIARKEILVTRFLAWLLDPHAQHSFGASFIPLCQ